MKRSVGVLVLAAALAAVPVVAQQPQVADAKAAAEVTTITAKVEAVDLANRTVTVKGPLGRTVALKVDDRVRNLAQVKVGDEIVLKYFEAVSVALVKGGGAPSASTATTAPITAPAGAKPGAAMAQQTKIVARVDKVDPARQLVLLEGPGGRYAEVKVRDADVFKNIKAGDNVDVTYTEAVVVDVVTPKK
jgi:hypothetical protein